MDRAPLCWTFVYDGPTPPGRGALEVSKCVHDNLPQNDILFFALRVSRSETVGLTWNWT